MSNQPEWLSKTKIRITIDARPIIESGGHPLDKVFKESENLASGEILALITPFPPVPLIEKMEARGFRSWSKEENGIFYNYFLNE